MDLISNSVPHVAYYSMRKRYHFTQPSVERGNVSVHSGVSTLLDISHSGDLCTLTLWPLLSSGFVKLLDSILIKLFSRRQRAPPKKRGGR